MMGKAKVKSDHRISIPDGNRFLTTPRTTIQTLLKTVSSRAAMVYLAIALRFNGYNNGKIGISMREIAETIGSHDHGANARAIGELVNAGFLWIGATYPKGSRLAREYGLSYITSGEGGKVPATHAYLETSKQKRRRKNGTQEAVSVENIHTERKRSVEDFQPEPTETCEVDTEAPVEKSTTHLYSQGRGIDDGEFDRDVSTSSKTAPRANTSVIQLDRLRTLTRHYVEQAPLGAQSKLAIEAGIQRGTLSKFINGRGLPEAQRIPLQLALGRRGALQGGAT